MIHSAEILLSQISKALAEQRYDFKPKELFEPIEYTMSMGGKRIRPLLTLMACEMFGGDFQDALYPALGLELFHNFTLIHDDILDNASMRRGKPTVYKKWNINRAILSGDTMFAMSYNYFFKTRDEFVIPVLKVFNKTAIEVCQGQQHDMNFETETGVGIEDYLEMIRLKTAVLLGACVQIGAVTGRASEADISRIYDFAVNMGMAFQLKDDILDLYSDESLFGKKTGGDIIANKKTFLFLKALALSKGIQKDNLIDLFSRTDFDPAQKVKAVRIIYDELSIKQHTETAIENYYTKALGAMDEIKVNNSQKEALLQFATALMNREK